MPLIEWTAELSVGIASIDEQHKKLVNMINALNDAMLLGESNELLGTIFSGLATYTQKHFAYEENMFAEYGYADSEEHKRQHNELIAQVVELKEKFIENPQGTISADLMLFLKRWLTNHIMRTDKEYTEFLLSKGVK
ncbi:MAG: bacteriohemerythrin [Colwellia sp.]|nr:bacteriohemerythrin [Colwellia sp.]MCW8866622.1 bacteriohemerythrin [Colwellia sp.]MCW9082852.1 bacteriohemerythrin [Colwellia sp.]